MVLNTKTIELENKILSVSGLVKKIDKINDAKIQDIEGKHFTTADYNNVTSEILDVKIIRKKLINKSDAAKKLININKKIASNKTKHVEVEKKT